MYEKVKPRYEAIYARYENNIMKCCCSCNAPEKCLTRDCIDTVVKIEPYKSIKDCINHNREIDTSKIIG